MITEFIDGLQQFHFLQNALITAIAIGIVAADSRLVREGGLEPPRRKAQEPKSCVSANFTTRAR